jgi:hypothetical protein
MNLHVQDILDVYFITIRLCYPCWSFVYLFALSYYVFAFVVLCCDVCYDFRIKRCSVRLYLLLFVGGVMSYLCLFVYSGVPHILCRGFFLYFIRLRLVPCVHIAARFPGLSSSLTLRFSLTFIVSGLSILVWPFGFSNVDHDFGN